MEETFLIPNFYDRKQNNISNVTKCNFFTCIHILFDKYDYIGKIMVTLRYRSFYILSAPFLWDNYLVIIAIYID